MLDKVALKLPIPTKCDCCGSTEVILRERKGYRRSLEANPWFWAYCCGSCDASVGTHKGTFYPYGYMADSRTRVLRAKLHVAFDKLWKNQVMRRNDAYRWLSRQLGIERESCHIGLLSGSDLQKALKLVTEQYDELEKVYARREQKRIERDIKRSERSVKRCGLRLAIGK